MRDRTAQKVTVALDDEDGSGAAAAAQLKASDR
jgi:hypothetical protein